MRKIVLLLLCMSLLVVSGSLAFDPKAMKEKNCAKCHTLKNEEAATLLKSTIPDAKVLSIEPAPIKGLWEVFVQAGPQKGLVYIDYSKKHFVAGGIVDMKSGVNLSADRGRDLSERFATKVDFAKIPTADALVLGDPAAAIKVIVFSDPDCPYCGKLHTEMKKVIEKRKDIVFLIKLFPLPMHKEAGWKAKTIICEKSMQYMEDNFEGKEIPKKECDTKAVEENMKLAQELGISGTPALITPDGRILSGYREADVLIGEVTKKPEKKVDPKAKGKK